MTIPTSTVPAVKAYLFAQLEAACTKDPSDNGTHALLVSYDEPGPYEPDDIVSVGAVTERRLTPLAFVGSGGANALREDYALEITIDVFRGGDQAQTCYERAWALLGQVETAVRADPTLGGLVEQAWPRLARDEPAWDEEHKGRRVRLTVSVDCAVAL